MAHIATPQSIKMFVKSSIGRVRLSLVINSSQAIIDQGMHECGIF